MHEPSAPIRRWTNEKPALWRGFRPKFAMVLGALSLSVAPAFTADYLIEPGDVLQVDIAGLSEMEQTMPVGADGMIRVPFAGAVRVAGRNIHDINELLQARLASKTFRQSTPSGEEFLVVIDPERIVVSVAEYRPVYLAGDVVSPGAQQYRPGMTLRQAISLAGGYGTDGQPRSDMFLQTADFRAEHISLWTQFTRETMRIARIRSELANADSPPSFDVEGIPLPPATVDELKRLEAEIFNLNRADKAKERAFLEREIENSQTQLETVKEQQEQEREGLEADTAELARHQELEGRGITTSSRVSESRRNLLMSSTRYLQATVQIAQFGREEASLRRRLQEQEDERRAELLDELQEAIVSSTSIAEQIAAVSEKLRYARAAPTSFLQEPAEGPSVTVIRNGDAGPASISVDEDMPLMPGDVVEVKLPADPSRLDAFLQN